LGAFATDGAKLWFDLLIRLLENKTEPWPKSERSAGTLTTVESTNYFLNEKRANTRDPRLEVIKRGAFPWLGRLSEKNLEEERALGAPT
jgi:hypothetical protein